MFGNFLVIDMKGKQAQETCRGALKASWAEPVMVLEGGRYEVL